MKDKRGIQLTMNMIVVVILALIFMIIAVSLTYSWFSRIEIPEFPSNCEIYPPDGSSPVCVNTEYELKRGSEALLEVSFYNDEDNDIVSTILPEVICGTNINGDSLAISSTSIGNDLAVGNVADYQVIVKLPKDAKRGSYPCNLKLSSTQQSFVIKVI